MDSKIIHLKLDRNSELTITDLFEKIEEFQKENPDRDVFFDGDEFAICSRPKREE